MFKPLLLLILGSVSSLLATDISGKWVGIIELPIPGYSIAGAKTTRLFLSLHQNGQLVEGNVSFFDDKGMSYPARSTSLNGNILLFDTVYGGWPLTFRLTVANGKMIGVGNYNGLEARVTLTGPVVTFPAVLHRVKAEYTDEGRRSKNEGTVTLIVQVDKTGHATAVKVVRAIGNGLDEMAVEAVKTWRFRPATDHGKPVPMETTVEVPFRLR